MLGACHGMRGPLASAELVPLSAAGREPLFFFGTLMDESVLSYVLGRELGGDELAAAVIEGFRRVCTRVGSYPVLVPASGEQVEGRLLRRASRRDIARINHFESEEYHAELHLVRWHGGAGPAWLYRGLEHLEILDEPWSLAAWQERHKSGFFAACARWMQDFQEPP